MKERINEIISTSQQEWLERHAHQKMGPENTNESLIQKILNLQEKQPTRLSEFEAALKKYETPKAS